MPVKSLLSSACQASACRPQLCFKRVSSRMWGRNFHTARTPWITPLLSGVPRPARWATSLATSGEGSDKGYQLPSQAIQDILDAPVTPSYAFSPDRSKILKIGRTSLYPPITDLMRPELKLAGLRIDPQISARSRMGYSVSLSLLTFTADMSATDFISDLPEQKVLGIPESMVINYVRWSPDGQHFAFTLRSAGGPQDPPRQPLELWVASVHDLQARRLVEASPTSGMNSIFEDYVWIDNTTIITSLIPPGREPMPTAPDVPVGPKISDNTAGIVSQARTYPDLLKNPYDEDLFEWLTNSTLELVDVTSGKRTEIGPPRMYVACDASPDGQYIIVSWMNRPFSYELPCGRFPRTWQVWDRSGKCVREIADLELLTSIPIDFDATRKGPRSIDWRSDKPCTLTWVEAQDEGDPRKFPDISPRDIAYAVDFSQAPDAEPTQIAATDMRFGGLAWCDDDLALVYESQWKNRHSRVWTIKPLDPSSAPQILFDRSYEDVYSDPGSPMYCKHPTLPTNIIAKLNGKRQLLLAGTGASPEGNRPFLDVMDIDTKETKRIWRSSPPHYESPSSIMNDHRAHPLTLDDLQIMFTRESQRDPPQFHVQQFTEDASKRIDRQLTNEPHPYPQLRDMQKQILRYKRADGVDLTATLHLPPGYDKDKDGPLPCLMWAYPREYKSKDAAGQLNKSPHEFSGIDGASPLVWLAKRYAILSGPSMPIVAEGDEEPNDTYVQQLVASATAAVEEVVRLGVADPKRIAIGGHSYGAFMTANILAHCGDLFACGIAQSGAYNRTLTPFGFQSEQRTFWQAPEVYNMMASFNHADKIKKPILLIHGEADNNTGTFPLQSERFYAALQGHGCVTRLVLLPHESHGYRAYESIMHVLSEVERWLERYC